MARSKSKNTKDSAAHFGFGAKFWLTADMLRNMDAAVEHVVLRLILLKYIFDTFEEHHAKLAAGEGANAGNHPGDEVGRQADLLRRNPGSARICSSGLPSLAPTPVPRARWSFIR